MDHKNAPVSLIILDGFGYKKDIKDNAITPHTMPFFFSLLSRFPWTTLRASGEAVGLPKNIPGNSAVGHFTLGAGEIVKQPLTQYENMVTEHTIDIQPVVKKYFTQLASTQKTLHIMALISQGNVHDSLEFTQELIACAKRYGIAHIMVHAILDGRDTSQKSAASFLEKIDAPIATLQGRFYAMDRNENRSRILKAYDILTSEHVINYASWQQALSYYYSNNIYDEIIPPTQLLPHSSINEGDGFILTTIRADRGRELYRLLKNNKKLSFLITGIPYDAAENTEDAFCKAPLAKHTLGDYLQEKNISFFTAAESEKYAHVTYFLHGGKEVKRPQEKRIIIPSGPCDNLKKNPAMKAREITDAVINNVAKNDRADFYIINYANADMVGHTGDLKATEHAVSVLDTQLERLYNIFVKDLHGTLYITGDHGNAEEKAHNSPTHTCNPVYFLVVQPQENATPSLKGLTALADIKKFIIEHSLAAMSA